MRSPCGFRQTPSRSRSTSCATRGPCATRRLARNESRESRGVTVTLQASAKINLDLRIVGGRPDGFHELRTVFQTLALADVLTIRSTRGPFRLAGSAPGVPLDRRNRAWRAAAAAWRAAGERGPVRGLSIALEKRIPAAAGLGGGSSDAAATVLGVTRVLGLGLGPAELHRAAVSLGADVPFS